MKRTFYPLRLANFVLSFVVLLATLLQNNTASAQCTAPAGATITATPPTCQGQGSIVAKITSPLAGAVYQYQLRYDSAANTSVVKPWQANDTFTHVGAGRYKAYIRRVCTSSFSTEYISQSIIVPAAPSPLSVDQVVLTNQPNLMPTFSLSFFQAADLISMSDFPFYT